MADGQNTTLNKANNTSESLRTTVPSSIVKHYRLSEGDRLNWDFEARNGDIIVVVRPAKKD